MGKSSRLIRLIGPGWQGRKFGVSDEDIKIDLAGN